jgi:16S rRNA (uracil1498-N3)-methyltransferase
MAGAAWAADADAVAHVIVDGALADEIVIGGTDGHHLQRVRRLGPGEIVTSADGSGTWREYRIAQASSGALTLAAIGEPHVEPTLSPPLGVAFALTKGAKPDVVAARLTELGVDRLVPVMARRSVARWDGERGDKARERLQRIVREAAMQSRRSRLPTVEAAVPLASLASTPGLVLADRDGSPASALDAGPQGWLVIVGPEGGLDDEEVHELGDPPRLGVGPHVLRAETAAVAAAAVLTGLRGPGGHGA